MADLTYSEWAKNNPVAVRAIASRRGQEMPDIWGTAVAPVAAPPPAEPELVGAPPMQEAPSPLLTEQRPPEVAPVTMSTGNPSRALRDIQAARIDSANEIAASQIREGESKAQAAEKNVTELGSYSDKAEKRAQAAEDNHTENREYQSKYKRYLDEDLETYRAPIIDDRTGMQKFTGVVSGIVAAMASREGGIGGAGLAAGMGMLNENVNKSLTDQLSARDHAGKKMEQTEKAIRALAADSESEIDVANKLMANQWLIAESHLKKIGEEAKSEQSRETAFQLATGARDNALGYHEKIVEAKLRASASGRKPMDFTKVDTQTLEAWAASGQLPPDGRRVLEMRLESKGKDALAAKNTESEIAKRGQDASKTKLTESQQKADTQIAGAADSWRRMKQYAYKPDGTNVDFKTDKPDLPSYGVTRGDWLSDNFVPEENVQYRRDALNLMNAAMRGESGASFSDAEVQIKAEAQGLFSPDEAVRLRGLQTLMSQVEALDQNAGKRLPPRDDKPAPVAGSGSPSPDPRLVPGRVPVAVGRAM